MSELSWIKTRDCIIEIVYTHPLWEDQYAHYQVWGGVATAVTRTLALYQAKGLLQYFVLPATEELPFGKLSAWRQWSLIAGTVDTLHDLMQAGGGDLG